MSFMQQKERESREKRNVFILDYPNFLSPVVEHDQNESKTFHNNNLKTATTTEQTQTRKQTSMDPKLIIEPILRLKNEEESALLSKSSDPVLEKQRDHQIRA